MKKGRTKNRRETKTRYSLITTLSDPAMCNDKDCEFIQMLNNSRGTLFQICLHFTDGGAESICDLYQEMSRALWESWPTFRGESRVDTWVHRVALNVAISEIRRKKRRPHFVPLEEWIYETVSEEIDKAPPDYYRVIKALEAEERALLYLRLDKVPLSEIAALYNTTETAIKHRLSRLRKKIQTIKQQEYEKE